MLKKKPWALICPRLWIRKRIRSIPGQTSPVKIKIEALPRLIVFHHIPYGFFLRKILFLYKFSPLVKTFFWVKKGFLWIILLTFIPNILRMPLWNKQERQLFKHLGAGGAAPKGRCARQNSIRNIINRGLTSRDPTVFCFWFRVSKMGRGAFVLTAFFYVRSPLSSVRCFLFKDFLPSTVNPKHTHSRS